MLFGERRYAEALVAVEKAIERGFANVSEEPARLAYKLKGDALTALDASRNLEAAGCYYQAAAAFQRLNDLRSAAELLDKAVGLDQAEPIYRWELADVLRRLAWRPTGLGFDAEVSTNSLLLWTGGTTIRLPRETEDWVYVVRGFLGENLSKLDREAELERCWESVAYLERAVILNDQNPYSWSMLGRFHRRLKNLLVARRAVERTLALIPGDLVINLEFLGVLIDSARFEESEELMGRLVIEHQNLDEMNWFRSARAYLLKTKGRLLEAYDVLTQIVSKETDDGSELWDLGNRATIGFFLGRRDEAHTDVERICRICQAHPELNNMCHYRSLFGRALLLLRRFEEAERVLSELRQNPVQGGVATIGMAAIRLLQGRIVEAESDFNEGIAKTYLVRELSEVKDEFLPEVQRMLQSIGRLEESKHILAKFLEQIDSRRAELNKDKTPQAELLRGLQFEFIPTSSPDWSWIGKMAGIAALEFEAGRFESGKNLYDIIARRSEFAKLGSLPAFPRSEAELPARRLAARASAASNPNSEAPPSATDG